LHQGTKVGHNMTGPVLPSRITALYTSPLSLRRRFFYPFGVYEPLFHSPTTNVREKNRREWPSVRTHALERGTPSRMRMSRREERERERGTPSVCVFLRAHILFHLMRTLIWLALRLQQRRRTDHLTSVCLTLRMWF